MKSKFKYLIIGIILLPHFLLAQTYLDTICWITVEKPGYYATNGENFTADENLNTLLQNNGVVYYEQAASFAPERGGFEPNAPICSKSVIYKNSFR